MITSETFTPEWLEHFRREPRHRRINPPVFEKMTYALLLLEKLAQTGLEFVFKGGTSIVLLTDSTNRFSVDIDIMTESSKEDIQATLNSVVVNPHFLRWEEDVRVGGGGVPKAHYKVRYSSPTNPNANILLDVLMDNVCYPRLVSLPIRCKWISTSVPYYKVRTPDIDTLLGDKLTAFAPNTTGIRHNVGKHIEMVKQLYDVGVLTDHISDMAVVTAAFKEVATKQIEYRGLGVSLSDVCDDIISTALIIAKGSRNMNIGEDREKMMEIKAGLRGFQGYLMEGSFNADAAVIASAKAAHLAAKIKIGDCRNPDLYDTSKSEEIIANPEYNFLNRLIKTNKEAYHHWRITLWLLGLDK